MVQSQTASSCAFLCTGTLGSLHGALGLEPLLLGERLVEQWLCSQRLLGCLRAGDEKGEEGARFAFSATALD